MERARALKPPLNAHSCSRALQAGIVEMTPALRGKLLDEVTNMAKRGLRCICLSYTDYPISDPSRPESECSRRPLLCALIQGLGRQGRAVWAVRLEDTATDVLVQPRGAACATASTAGCMTGDGSHPGNVRHNSISP